MDIGSSDIKVVIAQHNLDYSINILGTSTKQSEGINKGVISNIELASQCIQEAVLLARRNTTENIDSTVVSISGAYTKSFRSEGSVNIQNGLITENEIDQVLQMALYNKTIVPEYEVVHVVPIFFKIDDTVDVENPLDMNGSRLEASVYIVTAKKTSLTNIKSTLKSAGILVTNFVLDGYATAIAVLDEQQKKFGATVINIGATTTQIVCYKGNSLIFNDFISIGSHHITNDLSVMVHTPLQAAEKIKTEYGNLLKDKNEEELSIKKVRVPRIGDEQSSSEVSLEYIKTIIHARVEEILFLIKAKIDSSGINDNLGAGIVITGGICELNGLKELASLVFDKMPVKISNPVNIKNGHISFEEPNMSTIVGLILFSLDTNRNFELDSSKSLVKKIQKEKVMSLGDANHKIDKVHIEKTDIKDVKLSHNENEILPKIQKNKKGQGMVLKFWNKMSEWF